MNIYQEVWFVQILTAAYTHFLDLCVDITILYYLKFYFHLAGRFVNEQTEKCIVFQAECI